MDRKESVSVKQFYDCAEEIAQILDKYQHNPIEDMSNINDLIEKEKSIDKFIAEHGVRPDELDERATQDVQERTPKVYDNPLGAK
jgi:hypothetical protein